MKKKLLSFLIALTLVFTLIPGMTYEAEADKYLSAWDSLNDYFSYWDETIDELYTDHDFSINALDKNGVRTIWLYQDIDEDKKTATFEIPEDKSVVLRMNGHTINASGAAISIFKVATGASLTVIEGTITGGNAPSAGGAFYNHGNLSLLGVNVVDNKAGAMGGAIYNTETGKVSIDAFFYGGSNISRNYAGLGGGAILNDGGTCSLGNVTLEENTTVGVGGAIATSGYVGLSSATTIKNCEARLGGAVGIITNGWLDAVGSKFESCKASGGGAIYVANTGTASIGSSLAYTYDAIKDCEAERGGAIYSLGAVGVENARITSNKATGYGGGIYIRDDATLFLGRTAQITGNTCNGKPSNVLIGDDVRFVKFGTGEDVQAPKPGMKVGVSVFEAPTAGHPFALTINGTEDYAEYLESDNSDYKIRYATDHFELYVDAPAPGPDPAPGPAPEPAPEPEKYTIPVTGENTVQIEAQIKDGDAAVSEITTQDIAEVFDKTGDETDVSKITVDLSQTKEAVESATLTKTSVANIAAAVSGEASAVESLEVKLTNANLLLDAEAIKSINNQAKGNTIQLIVKDKDKASLTDVQNDALKEDDVAGVFDASILSNGVPIHDFGGGIIEVSVKYTGNKNQNKFLIKYIDDKGGVETYPATYENGHIKFKTKHFSTYVIVREVEKAPTTEEIAASALAINSGLKVTQSGKKLDISWGKSENVDGYFVYAAYCGDSFKRVKTITGADVTDCTIKKLGGNALNTKKNFKVRIKGYKLVNGEKVACGKSIIAHVVGADNKKYTNPASIKITSDKSVELDEGTSLKIKAKVTLTDAARKPLGTKHAQELRYASGNTAVATVSATGKIKAVGAGSCEIYVYARNGIAEKLTVTVK